MRDSAATQPLVFFSAGEVSGDIYGSLLLKALFQEYPNIHCMGIGGPHMQRAGMTLIANVIVRSAVGLWENIPQIPFFMHFWQQIQAQLRQLRPTLLVLIDFQGFNLQLAAWGKARHIPVVYLMAPQEWLWGLPGGITRLKKRIDHILAVFPPEADFYRKADVPVTFIGHPLLDILPPVTPLLFNPSQICLMPGSRFQEIKQILPILLALVAQWQHRPLKWVLPVADPVWATMIQDLIGQLPIQCVPNTERYAVIQQSSLVLAASGNAILESLLLGRPAVALYKVNVLTAWVAQHLMRQTWITLPNILMQRQVVPELLQGAATVSALSQWAHRLLQDSAERQVQVATTTWLRQYLGPTGAMKRAVTLLSRYW